MGADDATNPSTAAGAVEADEGGIAAAGSATATVHIRCSNGSKYSVHTTLEAKVGAFKAVVAGSCDLPAEQQRLIYKGRILKDDQTLTSYGVESDHTIHLVRSVVPSTTLAASATVTAGASVTPNNASSETLGGSALPGLGTGLAGSRLSGLFGTGFPELDQVQQQLSLNPNIMREIMNMPAIQNLMNNPDLIRSFFMNNPQMREIIDRNPDLAHVLNDPSTLRQTLEAARNPELMREMMRNTDRAMSNIESSPEGFNMLRRMYETVQEPFLNAATMGGDLGNDTGSNPFTALLRNQGTNQSMDRSSNSPTATSDATNGSPAPNTDPLPNPWSPSTGGAQPLGARLNPGSDTRGPSIAGLGGTVLPELERMMGRMQDSSHLNQVMQNPAMTQMMQNLLSDPQYVNQILNVNPNLRSLMESNTQLREMLQNPDYLRQLMSPETMQQLLSLQQSLFSHIGSQQRPREQNQAGGGTGNDNAIGTPNNRGLDFLMNMLGGLGSGGLGAPNTSNVPPEELYANQLLQLQEMGFLDTQENIRALIATAGNVHAAIERLLGNPDQ